jgi:uncharacterized protein YxjI
MGCGNPILPDAQFCAKCGKPVASTPSAAGMSSGGTPGDPLFSSGPTPLAPVTAPVSGAGLSERLGLRGQKNFLVQHQMLSLGHSYRVMDASSRHLFTIRGDTGQNLGGNALGGLLGGSDSYLGRMATRSVNMTYSLVDAQGAVLGSIAKEGGANQSQFTMTDSAGQRCVLVSMDRGLMGGMTATAMSPDGRPLLQTSGNLLRHNFVIKDAGGADLAKVHEAWVAVRDTYNVDMLGSVDPIYPLVFTILIDFEKVK